MLLGSSLGRSDVTNQVSLVENTILHPLADCMVQLKTVAWKHQARLARRSLLWIPTSGDSVLPESLAVYLYSRCTPQVL